MIDVIIISNAFNEKCKQLTLDCLTSLRNAKNITKTNVVVVEQQNIEYDVTTLHYDFDFHYHKCITHAINNTNSKYIAVCNNDLYFEDGWADALMTAFMMGYRSLSPYCRRSHKLPKGLHLYEGYQVGVHVAGWCIACERSVIKDIGGLNEDVEFWYSDNIYAEQLKKAEIKHALVCNSFVTHTPSRTLMSISSRERYQKTAEQKKKYQTALKKLYAKE